MRRRPISPMGVGSGGDSIPLPTPLDERGMVEERVVGRLSDHAAINLEDMTSDQASAPSVYDHYLRNRAWYAHQERLASLARDEIEAEITQEVRDRLGASGGKITDKGVAAMALRHPRLQAAEANLEKVRYYLALADGATKVMEAKIRMLMGLSADERRKFYKREV